jgi:hypothetical protein
MRSGLALCGGTPIQPRHAPFVTADLWRSNERAHLTVRNPPSSFA